MAFVCRLYGSVYKVRVSHGLRATVFKLDVVKELDGRTRVKFTRHPKLKGSEY